MLEAWLLLALSSIATSETLAANCDASLCWDISPQICITEQPNQQCQTELQLHWTSQRALNACLFLAEQKLHCWRNSSQGQWQQVVSWQSATLSLRDDNNQVLLQTELQVLSRKPARRRLSSPWSIF